MTQPLQPDPVGALISDLQQRVAYLQTHAHIAFHDQNSNTLMDLFGMRLGITQLATSSTITTPSGGISLINSPWWLHPAASEVFANADYPLSAGTTNNPYFSISGPLQTTRTNPFTITTSAAGEQTEILVTGNIGAFESLSHTSTAGQFEFDGANTAGGIRIVIQDSLGNNVANGQQFNFQGTQAEIYLDGGTGGSYVPYLYVPMTASMDAGETAITINNAPFTQGTFTAIVQYFLYWTGASTSLPAMEIDVENLQVLKFGHS